MHEIYGTIRALEGHAEDTDNKVVLTSAHCIAPRLTVKIRPTDYDEADEFVRVYINGNFLSICNPNDGQGCNREFTCLDKQDITPFMVAVEGQIEVQLVNSDDVTYATSSQATLATGTTCDGNGNIGPYLLAADVTLDGCGSTESLGLLNDLWAFDGKKWKWDSPDNNTGIPSQYGAQAVADVDSWPGSRARHAVWSDGNGSVWVQIPWSALNPALLT